jgi:hypothetical protein
MQKYALKKFNCIKHCHDTDFVLTLHIIQQTRINTQMQINPHSTLGI